MTDLTVHYVFVPQHGYHWRASCPLCRWQRDYQIEDNAVDALRGHAHCAHKSALTPSHAVSREHS